MVFWFTMFDFRNTATSQAVSAFAGAAALLLVPDALLGVFGVEGAGVGLVGRLAGGMMLALGATLWGARGLSDTHLQRVIVAGNASCDLTLAVAFGHAAMHGTTNGFGYGLSVLFAANAASWLAALRPAPTIHAN